MATIIIEIETGSDSVERLHIVTQIRRVATDIYWRRSTLTGEKRTLIAELPQVDYRYWINAPNVGVEVIDDYSAGFAGNQTYPPPMADLTELNAAHVRNVRAYQESDNPANLHDTQVGTFLVDDAMHAAARVIEQIQFGVFPSWDNLVAARHWFAQYLANYPQPVLSHLEYLKKIDPNKPTPKRDVIYPRWSIPAYQHTHLWDSDVMLFGEDDELGITCACGDSQALIQLYVSASEDRNDGRSNDWSWCANPGQPEITWHNALILAHRMIAYAAIRDVDSVVSSRWETLRYKRNFVDNPLRGANLNS